MKKPSTETTQTVRSTMSPLIATMRFNCTGSSRRVGLPLLFSRGSSRNARHTLYSPSSSPAYSAISEAAATPGTSQ